MSNLKTDTMTRSAILAALRNIKSSDFYVWDGVDEDDRPLCDEELQVVLKQIRKRREVKLANAHE